MSDDEVRVFNGIRLGAINGIAALRRREKKGIPRKRPEEFIEYGKRLSGKVDVLLLHGSSWIEEYIGMVARNERTAAVAIAIYETIPKLVFCGHLPPYTIHRFDFGTTYICIDISQKHKCYCYAILSIKQYGGRGMERS